MKAIRIIRQLAVRHFHCYKTICVPNVTDGPCGWEADLLVLRPSGWAVEVEVKTTLSDLKRDFKTKAHKHKIIERGIPEPNWNQHHWQRTLDWGKCKPHKCKQFWFCVPIDIVDKAIPLIPDYAGLLVCKDAGLHAYPDLLYFDIAKEAPKLKNSRKYTDAERIKLLQTAYFRLWDFWGTAKMVGGEKES